MKSFPSVILLVWVTLSSSPWSLAGEDSAPASTGSKTESSDGPSIKDEFKNLGHAFKAGAKATGHVFKKGAKATGKAFTAFGKSLTEDVSSNSKSPKKNSADGGTTGAPSK